jgi:hypothetical protein
VGVMLTTCAILPNISFEIRRQIKITVDKQDIVNNQDTIADWSIVDRSE